MAILIDGYNLMYAAGIIGRSPARGGLERSRLALLNFVAESAPATELPTTTIVFDSRSAPPGLPRKLTHRGMTVLFATTYESADELIEELIRADHAPRRLTVVSSDHRLQRAARRRRAKAIDSDRWYEDILRQHASRGSPEPVAPLKPSVPAAGEVEYWLNQFDDEEIGEIAGDDIFPPGYGEDLEE